MNSLRTPRCQAEGPYLSEFLLRDEPSVAKQERPKSIRRSFWKLSSSEISDRPAVDFRASAVRMS